MTPDSAIGRAFAYALAAHEGQTDQAGAPYILHVVRVMARLTDPQERCVALLHDVVEDTDISLDELARSFSPAVVEAVEAITKSEGEAYDVYLARVADNPHALAVKRADMADNADPARLALLPEDKRARLTAKYDAARLQLDALAGASR